MKTMKRVSLKPLFLIIAFFLFTNTIAQNTDPKKEAGAEAEQSANSNISEGIDEGFKIESYTQYDFVPGDKILYYEDFSQDAIGDFPALWTTNGSGEVKTLNVAPGKWLHMNAEGTYSYTKEIDFPSNFIMEFDIIPNDEYNEFELTFYFSELRHRKKRKNL
jgi:OmpA-OmpF porin, OOP family